MDDLLFLSHRIPYPPTKGEKIRAWHFFAHLAKTYRMHLGCFIDDPADAAHIGFLRAMCADLHAVTLDRRRQKLRAMLGLRPGRPLTRDYFGHPDLKRWVDAKLASGTMARVFVFSSGMAGYAMGAAHDSANDSTPAGRILDMVDIDSEKWTELASLVGWPMRAVWGREGRTLRAFERAAVQAFDRTLFVSDAECQRFAALAPESAARIVAIENGVDLAFFAPDPAWPSPFPAGRKTIVFTGTMDYWPNADAMTWFGGEIMPRLRARHKGLLLAIVGANPTPAVTGLAGTDVMVTGRVVDVRPWLAHADVVVAPLRIARGIQNKVLEAMAMGRKVVASPQAFEGVRADPGTDLLVADGAEAIAQAIGAVLDGAHPAMGARGRLAMERAYAWPAKLARLDAVMALGAITAAGRR